MDTLDRAPSEPLLRSLIEAFDWSRSPLGDPARWPQSLRTALGICLGSRVPMTIFWGPELIQLYNDAYAPILGAQHPHALGRPARDGRPELWETIGPVVQGVLERGAAAWSENVRLPLERDATPDERAFTFSFSPIAEGERIGGVFCALAETTAPVVRNRTGGLAEVDRAATRRSAGGARPHILVVDDDADLRGYVARLLRDLYDVTMVADAFQALAQIARDRPDLVICDVLMPGLDGIAFVRQLRNAPQTRELPVILISARSDDDAAAGALAAGADAYVTKPFGAELLVQIERRITQARLRREEQAGFHAIADQVAQIMYTHARDGSLDWANARWYDYTQLPAHLALNVEGWAEVIEPGDLRRAFTLIDAAFRTGAPYEAELRIKPRGSTEEAYRWHLVRAVPMRDEAGTIVRWAGSATDVHDHRTSEALARDELEAQLAREHRTSLAFQNAALPKRLPVVAGLEFAALYAAAEKETFVGGDWYDAFRLDDGRVVISVGDVMGSGLDAAATMGAVRQAIRGAAQLYPDPASILDATDRALRLEQPDRIVTAFIGIIDPIVESLSFASAGHPPPLMRDPEGAVTPLTFVDLPLGLRDLRTTARATAAIRIRPGTTLVLYTDGLTESTRDVVEGERRLIEALAAGVDEPAAIRDRVATRTNDDVAILVVTVGTAHRPRWAEARLDERAYAIVRGAVMRALAEAGLSPAALADAELVVGELLGNVARHTQNGPVEVTLDLHGPEPVLHVADRGPGFAFNARLPSDMMSESGRGLFIAARLARELNVTRRNRGGSHARAVLAREPIA